MNFTQDELKLLEEIVALHMMAVLTSDFDPVEKRKWAASDQQILAKIKLNLSVPLFGY